VLAAPPYRGPRSNRLPSGPALTAALRWARLFDPVYFDRMLPNALLPLATGSTIHA